MNNSVYLPQPCKSLVELAQLNAKGKVAEVEALLNVTLPDNIKNVIERMTIEETFIPNKVLRPGYKLDLNMLRILCTTNANIELPVEDLMGYYNACLNDEQKHQVMTNLFINSLADVYHPATNPYTKQPYAESDVSYNDAYVALFFAKLSQLSETDTRELKLRLSVLMGATTTKLFNFFSFDTLMKEIQTQAYNAYTFLITMEDTGNYTPAQLSKLKAAQCSLSLLESIAAEDTETD